MTSCKKMPACCNVAGEMMNSTGGVVAADGDVAADVHVPIDATVGDVAAIDVSEGDGLAASDDVDFVLLFPPI